MSGIQSPGGFHYMAQNPTVIRAHRRGALPFICSFRSPVLCADKLPVGMDCPTP